VGADDPVEPVPDREPHGTKDHLYDVARRLGVRGRSTMSRGELVAAIEEVRARAAPVATGTEPPARSV
jgi:hypothetical protein